MWAPCVCGVAVCGGRRARERRSPPSNDRRLAGLVRDERGRARERVSALVEKAPERMLNDNAVIVLMRPSDEWTEMRWKGKGSEEEEGG